MKAILKFFLYMGLIMIVVYTSGCYGDGADNQKSSFKEELVTLENNHANIIVEDMTDTIDIVLYFADANNNLVAERREIPKVVGIARQTMLELCRGPENSSLFPCLPTGTELQDINIRDNLCTVVFKENLITHHSGEAEEESLTVFSIVNTLTQFSSVDKVQILIEGKKTNTLTGHINISDPLERNGDIISAI